MSHWKLTLSYDGTRFHGWQVQPGLPTIQGTLARALASLTGEDVLPQGSGRTDTGVHALAQVVSVTLAADIPAPSLFRALNRILPPSIRILSAEIVPASFHARFDARRKSYEYRIFEQRTLASQPQRFCSPFLTPYVWEYKWPLTLDLMQQAAASLIGTHDFTSFAASDPDLTQRSYLEDLSSRPFENVSSRPFENLSSRPERDGLIVTRSGETPVFRRNDARSASVTNPTRTIHTSTILRDNDLLIYRVTGSGFLHHMVRNIVGTLTDIGRGAISPDAIPRILAARDRSTAGPTAPPQGLYLVSVDYTQNPSEPTAK